METTRFIIISRMYNARVTLGRSLRNIVGRFEEQCLERVSTELPRDGTADATGTNYYNIIDDLLTRLGGISRLRSGTYRSRRTLRAVGRIGLERPSAVFEVDPVTGVVGALDPCDV
jgi:hypothetical protein